MVFNRVFSGVRADAFPSVIQGVRYHSGRQLSKNKLSSICDELSIEQQSTPDDASQFNGVAEHGLSITEVTTIPARIQARVLPDHFRLPKIEKL